jgi:hypothetical protein
MKRQMARVDSDERNNTNNQQDDIPPELDTRYRVVYLAAQRTKQLKQGAAPRINIDPRRQAKAHCVRRTD